ncbi:MAG TPA: gliding motility-associated C-terminal domain-containing protein [Flavobacterium sp.]|jgi:gliding motility-associated-like protein
MGLHKTALKAIIPDNKRFFLLLIMAFLLFSPKKLTAQCAGTDGTLTVCDIANPANQSIDLFLSLGGAPSAGGTWTDPLQTGALDPVTGILNIWNIHLSGVYNFTYTINNGCADNTAVVTVTVGGYSGIPSPDGSACNDDQQVNLFQFFVGTPPDPHQNGTWHDDDNSGALQGSTLNATLSGLGTFHFTYTMAAVGSCPATSSTISVTVFRVPKPGIPSDILLCNTVDFSLLTNVNLADFLSGEDANGHWSEGGTSELSSPFDPFIDIQNIYNTFGLGTYDFTYTVYPANPVCAIKQATISLIIEAPIDFTGAEFTVESDICENQIGTSTFSAVLTQPTLPVPAGPYTITYTVTGTTPFSHNATASYNVDNELLLPLNASYFPAVGAYNVTITNIRYLGNNGACENIINASDDLNIYAIPKINSATIAISPVCQNSDVVVTLSGTNNLGTGNYQVTYDLTGSNIVSGQIIVLNTTAGTGTFTIPAAMVPNSGTTTIKFTNIVNLATGCSNTSTLIKPFVINPIISVTANVSVDDVCEGQPVTAVLSGLANLGSITIGYGLSGANPSVEQSINVNATGGNAVFTIPPALLLSTGNTTLTILSITNTVTGCPVTINFMSDDFIINATPDAPVSNNAEFCKADNATIAQLSPAGQQYSWFATATGGTPLADSTLLVTGNYFVAEVNGTTGCSSVRTGISVVVIEVPVPILNPEGENFCGIDNPTLLDLANNTDAPAGIVWFDAASGGNQLTDADLLQQGLTYYGYGSSGATNCLSEEVLAVTVTLTDCDDTDYNFFIPDGFSPNGDSVNDVFQIPEIEFLFPDYTLEIYNRYGNLMFKGNINKPSWDGKNTQDGNLIDGTASNGVYFYVVDFNKNNAEPRQGFLYLNR